MERLELTAAPGDSGRLDAWLAGQCPTLSRSALQNLIVRRALAEIFIFTN